MNKRAPLAMVVAASAAFCLLQSDYVASQGVRTTARAKDPGVRGGDPGAGGPLPGMSATELAFFSDGRDDFAEAEEAKDGLGPSMNLNGCGGCHSHPAVGGSSPFTNPQVAFANELGASNRLPPFVTLNGPVREVRFIRNPDGSPDGGVHSLFTIAGRSDAPGCTLAQPDFAHEFARGNAIFRIPAPMFGAGLIEQIPDSAILANQGSNSVRKRGLGIRGRANFALAGRTISGQANNNGNDGTIARFGWKAQNKSILLFSAEAYNVEMGITNELFQTERDETVSCQFTPVPNDVTNVDAATPAEVLSAIVKFGMFQRFLAPPIPSTDTPGGAKSIANGRSLFASVGCSLCHTPAFRTGNSTVAALRDQPVNLYSDLLVHDMGPNLADGVTQAQAGPREFRSAPLWGLGQRIFFLHDGRTTDLADAIQQHASGSARRRDASEANGVVQNYTRLTESDKQDLLNFLRSL